jgi:DNA primase
LFAWQSVRQFFTVILVEGLFDLAVLWQAGFRNTTCAFGTHLTAAQFHQLCDQPGRRVFLVFDQDENLAGQHASQTLAGRLQQAGLAVSLVQLPAGQDPNSYFVGGGSVTDFISFLQGARPL